MHSVPSWFRMCPPITVSSWTITKRPAPYRFVPTIFNAFLGVLAHTSPMYKSRSASPCMRLILYFFIAEPTFKKAGRLLALGSAKSFNVFTVPCIVGLAEPIFTFICPAGSRTRHTPSGKASAQAGAGESLIFVDLGLSQHFWQGCTAFGKRRGKKPVIRIERHLFWVCRSGRVI